MRQLRLHWTLVAVVALTGLGLLLRVRGFGDGLDKDEGFTLTVVRGRDLSGVLHAVVHGARPGQPMEYTPPLFFLLAWLSAKIGDPATWIRMPSLVLGSATLPVVFLLSKRTVGRRAGLVAVGFLALSPFATFYATEARAYATLMFLSALSALLLLRALETERPGWWVGYGAAVLGVLLTHYTGVFVVGVELAWALWRHPARRRPILLTAAGVAVAYAPWLPHVHGGLGRVSALAALFGFTDWDALGQWLVGLPGRRLGEVPGTLPLVSFAVGVGAGLVAAGAAAYTRVKGRRTLASAEPTLILVFLLALATPVALLIYGLVGDDLFILPRNLSASLPFAALVIGWAVDRPSRPLMAAALCLVAIGVGAGALKVLADGFERPNYLAVARLLDDRAASRDLVLYYGAGFDPFTLREDIHLYFERRHRFGFSDIEPRAVERVFQRAGPGRVFAIAKGATSPPSVPGWEKIEQRAFGGRPPLAVAAYAPLRPGGYALTSRSIRRPGSAPIPVVPGRVLGIVDVAQAVDGATLARGWSTSPDHQPVDEVLAFSEDRLVAAGIPTVKRPDVAELWKVASDDLGFELAVPGDAGLGARITLLAVADGVATQLSCSPPARRVLGCD